MPSHFTLHNLQSGSSPFNKPPFDLQTILPSLGKQAHAKNLIFDIRTLPPSSFSFPFHYHRNAEETMYIISGTLSVRTSSGFFTATEGDVLFFETGESGAHQFYNHTNQPCRYFDVKIFIGMDVVVYPDSGKIMISQYNEAFELSSKVDYHTGEMNVAEKWRSLGYSLM